MKKLILVSFLFLFAIHSRSGAQTKEFTIGYSGTYPLQWMSVTNGTNWNWYNELSMNLWQGWYVGEAGTHGFVLDSLNSHDLKGYFQPDTLLQFALGKVTTNQAEDETADSFRYIYHNTIGSDYTETFNGETVKGRFFNEEEVPAIEKGIPLKVISELKENAIMSFSGLSLDPKKQLRWNSTGTQIDNGWYIKPRLRIDSTIAHGLNKNVLKLVIRAYNGDIILEQDITSNRFLDVNGNYNGGYLEDFFQNGINIKADTSSLGINKGYPPGVGHQNISYMNNCYVDVEIHWYREVSVWIDYVKIMDEPAYKLFEPGNIIKERIKNQIQRLINHSNGDRVRGFYTEEIEYSNIPCLAFLQDSIIPQAVSTSSAKLNSLINIWSFQYNLRSKDSSKRYDEYLDRVKPPELFFVMYPLDGPPGDYPAPLPNNIDSFYFPSDLPGAVKQRFAIFFSNDSNNYLISPAAYNDNIQSIWTKYEYFLDYFSSKINGRNKDFTIVTQILHEHQEQYYPLFREPMNSEISAQSYIAICRGAKGIFGYPYESWYQPAGSPSFPGFSGGITGYNINGGLTQIPTYIFGMTEFTGTTYWGIRKRAKNFYNENKWDHVRTMNEMIRSAGNIFANSNNTQGFSVDRVGANHNFISEIRSIFRDPASLDYVITNDDAAKYWEMGFFYPDYLEVNDMSKYFMMVNKRCVPDVNDDGDLRFLKIKFKSSELSGFNNWKITDVFSNSLIRTFDKDSNIFVSMGIFKPGEGKLYKLAPVMQEGGTLVADEEVQGVTFVCNAPVYNNGKNISILEGTKIEFKSGAGLNLNSGSLLCSNSSTNTEENVLLKGYNSQNWNGIALDNTYKSKIQRTRFEDTKTPLSIESSSGVNLYNGKIIRKNYFKITEDSGKALSIRNQHNVSIDSNIFDITSYNSTVGIYFENNMSTESEIIPAGSPQEDPEDVFAGYINITKNKFIGGCYPVILSELGDNFSAYYIYNNEFVNTGLFGITARKISGIIKQNRFTDEAQNYCLYLIESFPDMPSNIFRSEKKNIVLTNSFPMLAPIRNENGQLKFKGGRNSLIITTNNEPAENIYLKQSLPDIKLGENNFAIGNSYSYHIFGSIPPEGERYYNAIRNCWEGYNDIPSIFLFQGNDTNRLGYNYIPVSCIPSEETATETQGIGFGIIDSTIITAYDSTDILSDDESLFYGAIELEETGNYTEAIADFKALIDTHDSSEFIYSALDNLYSCYQAIDTSSDEEITDVLYSDLKEFLETKISSGNYDEEFEKNAYSFSLMCDTRLTNYNEALSGYEFIATYDPDAEQRLMASWEYENIEDMMNGEGGGRSNYELGIRNYESGDKEKEMSNLEFEKNVEKRIKELDEFVDRDPIKRHIKEEYVKTANKNENSKTVREGIYAQKNPNEEKLIERSRQNIYGSKNLSKQQKEIRRFEDLKLLLNPENLEVNKKIENAIPVEYSLSQNYPNPFNPITHLEFGISDLGFVSLKVYDVLGREIKTLVNEIRPPGIYKTEFDGSNFASGVYFYKLEAGEFVQTKRMVLIK